MTLDTYADLFDDDLGAVADRLDASVDNLWADEPQTSKTSLRKSR